MDIITQLGELAIGTRLKRLSDYMMEEGSKVYQTQKIDFDPKCFSVFYALTQYNSLSIMELAETLRLTHPAIIKLAKQLEKEGLIVSKQDPKDKRRRLLALSQKGKEQLPMLQEVWTDIAQTFNRVFQEQEQHLLQAVDQVERAFEQEGFSKRVREIRNQRLLAAVEIIAYQPELKEHFARINYNWINKYFTVEEADKKSLDNPEDDILNKGGYIYFARVDGEIAGTCALKNLGNGKYELAKMGVDDTFQGKQIGKKLGLAIIEKARAIGAKILWLESNRKLSPALNLYRRLGFKELPNTSDVSDYERSDIQMQIVFNENN